MTTPIDVDEALDAAAQGMQSDEGGDEDEIDAMGKAAGLVVEDGKALGGAFPIDRRDEKRWENDPASADDAAVDPDRTLR